MKMAFVTITAICPCLCVKPVAASQIPLVSIWAMISCLRKREKGAQEAAGQAIFATQLPFESDCRGDIRLTGEQGEGFCGGQ